MASFMVFLRVVLLVLTELSVLLCDVAAATDKRSDALELDGVAERHTSNTMGYQDDDGHYNRGSNRDYDRRGGGGGGGYRNDDRDYDRRGGGGGYRNDRRRRSGGGGYRDDRRNDRGGGYRNTKRRRTDYGGGGGGGPKLNAAPAVDMGAASSKLVQLLVRVADARARKTTDAEIPLADNLDALAGAIADKELDDGRRVAGQLVLVARASPLGARAFGALAALLAAKREGWATMVADAAGEAFMAALTCDPPRRVDAKLCLLLLVDLAARGVVETDGDRGLESLLRRLADAFDEPPASPAARDRADLCAGLVAAAAAAGAPGGFVSALERHVANRRAASARLRALGAPAASAPVDSLEALVFGLRDCAACRFDAVEVNSFGAPSPLPEVACAFTVPNWASCASGVRPTLPAAEDAMDDDGGLSALERAVLAEAAVDVVACFRPGARWDGIVLGSKAATAHQLDAVDELLSDDVKGALGPQVAAVVADALLAVVAAGAPVDAGFSSTEAPAKRGRADPGLDALHAVLELCALSPTGFAPKFANAVELFFRELDDVAAPAARRVAEFFAHFLSNTKFAWPYWSYWAAVADEDACDAQRRFVCCLLEHCVRLTYVDRLKCADGFPEALHALLPALPEARALLEEETAAALARDADEAALARVVDPPEDAAGEAREPRPADAALAAAFDALGDDAAKTAAVMRGVFARGAASFTHALAPLDDAELSAALRNLVCDDDDCEAAALDALVDVWAASAQHVALLADALVRRGVVRCRAVAAWVLDPRNESPWAGSAVGASFKPHELLQVAVDRSLDLLSAAVASAAARGADAATDGVVAAQLEEAHEVALEICSRLARGLCDRDGDDSADAAAYRDAALGTLADLRATYDNAAAAALPGIARSAPAAKLPDVLQASDLRGKLDVPVPAVAAAVDRALGLN